MEAKNINQLVTENLSYVKSLANRFKGKGVDFDDLVSEGYMAMTQAAQKYDTERGTQFIAYAAPFIRKAMEQAIKQQSASYGMPKDGHQQLNKKLSRPLDGNDSLRSHSADGEPHSCGGVCHHRHHCTAGGQQPDLPPCGGNVCGTACHLGAVRHHRGRRSVRRRRHDFRCAGNVHHLHRHSGKDHGRHTGTARQARRKKAPAVFRLAPEAAGENAA